jgi:hypothetical protein
LILIIKADGLQAALKLNWREKSTKICVLISDAPPHGLGDYSDGFPNGIKLILVIEKFIRVNAIFMISNRLS